MKPILVKLITTVFLSVFVFTNTHAQTIKLVNPSFEEIPQDATMPAGWHSCKNGTTPDILPGFWGVTTEAFDGDTYMGLITRDNGTWESVEQRLSEPLKKGECYAFDVKLCYSKQYAGYNLPLKLRIWGSETKCSRDQLLAETDFVKHTYWKKYELNFHVKKNINYIIIEAHYADGVFIPYKGNILVDDISEIELCKRASLN